MSKKSTLLTGMAVAAGKPLSVEEAPNHKERTTAKASGGVIMIGAHYPAEVRKALKFLEADTGRKLKPLLAEAINDLCAKYGRPQPCTIEN